MVGETENRQAKTSFAIQTIFGEAKGDVTGRHVKFNLLKCRPKGLAKSKSPAQSDPASPGPFLMVVDYHILRNTATYSKDVCYSET
jgi:hypothetical protein